LSKLLMCDIPFVFYDRSSCRHRRWWDVDVVLMWRRTTSK